MGIENGPGPDFLKQKYDLHNSPEVEAAAKRTESRTGEKVPQNPDDQIQNYLNRFQEITERENPEERERLLGALKNILHNQFVIKPEEIPEGYYENQQRLARELGHGDIDITPEMRDQLSEVIVTDQISTLDNWVDYLSSEDAIYPDWLKYFAIRSVTQMGGFDKERHAFSKRSKGTTKPFPDLNREALAYVLDAMSKKYEGRSIDTLEGEEKEQFNKLLTSENFAKLYGWAIEKVTPASVEQISITEGKWVKYNQNSDHMPLVESLQGHGTGWCTAGESTAEAQLKNGDFYVYYSIDPQGQPIIPRAAIRMQGSEIGEVRGIAPEQNLDPYINEVVDKKLQEFPDGKAYEKKNADMKYLTMIDRKIKADHELNKDDLVFLYEINSKIEGFGYQRDPRIAEIRSQRDPKIDAPIVMECNPQEIAWSQNEISENTKAYVGPLYAGIFKQLSNLEHIYTSFPEGKISQLELVIGAMSEKELRDKLDAIDPATGKRKINIYDNAKFMLDKMFQDKEYQERNQNRQNNPEQIDLIKLKVGDLGFPSGATTDQIYTKAQELGLELCPPEVGPYQRLKDENQLMNDYYRIAMKQISDRNGDPYVFDLNRSDGGLYLNDYWAEPAGRWNSDNELVFRIRKLET